MSEEKIHVLKKNATILQFEERLGHGNGDGNILATKLYVIPNDAGKTYLEGKKLSGETLTKAEDMESTTEDTSIKRDKTGKKKVDKKIKKLTRQLMALQENGHPTLIRK